MASNPDPAMTVDTFVEQLGERAKWPLELPECPTCKGTGKLGPHATAPSDDTLRALAYKYSDGWLADYECGKYQPLTDLLVTFARAVLARQGEQ